MIINFKKMHGASNDFILIDDRNESFPINDKQFISSIATRRTGIGCEGVILIQPSDKADFRMRFLNPDGSEVEMCGNGARCVARMAYDIKAAPKEMTIDTIAGILRARIDDDKVTLNMTQPKDWRSGEIELKEKIFSYDYINTGVPHVVIICDDIEKLNIHELGSAIRYHELFAPSGTNANFVTIKDKSNIVVRTYERGVEAETLACGTGMVASALVSAKRGLVSAPVNVIPASKDLITVNFKLNNSSADDVTLSGPAVYVFEGQINYSQ